MPHAKVGVPKNAQKYRHAFFKGPKIGFVLNQQQNVHVGMRKQLAPSVPSDSGDCDLWSSRPFQTVRGRRFDNAIGKLRSRCKKRLRTLIDVKCFEDVL
ncbi:MAG: hypothetical protein JOZ62_14540 [Acidobacteriaceae bacterium]|nr:hypothetical protein [Acidobacteriaceae bacterium]